MTAKQAATSETAVDAAFATVFDAEREAEAAVAGCRDAAAHCLAEAEVAAQKLAEQAAVRRQAWSERRGIALAGQLAALRREAEAAARPVTLDAAARARLATAVERLAAELCGPDRVTGSPPGGKG